MPLPGKRPDKYENVDITNYSTVDKMTRAEMLEMASLSEFRGDMGAKARWNEYAREDARTEEIKESAVRMGKLTEPKYAGIPGRIVETPENTPWGQDAEYQKLQASHAKAKKALSESRDGDADLLKLSNAVADSHDAMVEREREIKGGLSVTGVFTEQDQRIMDAQVNLAAKAAQVGKQVG